MSGGGNPLYRLVKQDSRNAAFLGNAIGGKVGQTIEDEANYNTKNPGHALTKAAESAALWYLGGAAGAAGSGAPAATDAAESGGTLALNSAGNGVTPYLAQMAGGSGGNLLASQAPQLAQKAEQLYGGLDPETQSGLGGMGVAQNGIGPGSLLDQVRGTVANPGSLTNGTNGLLSRIESNAMNPDARTRLAFNYGNQLMQPQQQERPMPAPRGPMPQQQTPLPLPYQNSLTSGQSSMSASLPPPGMSYAEWLRRKQLLGGMQ